jgi:hypothetical protein
MLRQVTWKRWRGTRALRSRRRTGLAYRGSARGARRRRPCGRARSGRGRDRRGPPSRRFRLLGTPALLEPSRLGPGRRRPGLLEHVGGIVEVARPSGPAASCGGDDADSCERGGQPARVMTCPQDRSAIHAHALMKVRATSLLARLPRGGTSGFRSRLVVPRGASVERPARRLVHSVIRYAAEACFYSRFYWSLSGERVARSRDRWGFFTRDEAFGQGARRSRCDRRKGQGRGGRLVALEP